MPMDYVLEIEKKYIYRIADIQPVSALFQYNSVIHTHNTRRSKFIHTPIGRSEATYRTFSYRGAHIWNYISQNVPTDVSCACFKNLVKTHILAHLIPHFRLNI